MGGKLTVGGVAIALVFLNATHAFSDPSVEQINAVVKACIEVANAQNVGNPNVGKWHFDAYYNAATGRVHNNAETMPSGGIKPYQHPSLFAFQKCMAERGFPLGNNGERGE